MIPALYLWAVYICLRHYSSNYARHWMKVIPVLLLLRSWYYSLTDGWMSHERGLGLGSPGKNPPQASLARAETWIIMNWKWKLDKYYSLMVCLWAHYGCRSNKFPVFSWLFLLPKWPRFAAQHSALDLDMYMWSWSNLRSLNPNRWFWRITPDPKLQSTGSTPRKNGSKP